ncbi:MAG: 5'-nucleotidase C-terminal domain-containing protein [Acidimicrobiia bacterium]|nr:5'-nucleotidase C-terminal domain-containing protein [Acidimicrobiia bacterium]
MSSARSTYRRPRTALVVLAVLIGLAVPIAAAPAGAAGPIPFTILHTNDFHGNLEGGYNPGAARVATIVNDVRTAVGADNVLLLDAGDMMQGTLLSNLQRGVPVIDYMNTLGFDLAVFGNHEFDWGQTVLGDRVAQAAFPIISANVTLKDGGGNCTWTPYGDAAYEVLTVGTAPNTVDIGVIGVTSIETPYITIAEATAGLCFRDPLESILHYYDEVAAQSDVMVLLSHVGYESGGYGYGFDVDGDKTLAADLNAAGKPADIIIGGHSHTNLGAATMVGNTAVVQAYYAGRRVGRADMTYDPGTGAVTIAWASVSTYPPVAEDPTIAALVAGYATDPAYLALINEPVGYVQTDLLRDYNGNSMMADFVDDAVYGALNGDADPLNDADMVFQNSGGIRTDWCDKWDGAAWVWSTSSGDCEPGVWAHDPMLLTYGQMYQILPFGNATAIGDMTGAQIYDLLNQSATLFKGTIQPAGIRYKFFRYSDALPGPQPYAWGAYDVEVWDKATAAWLPLDMDKTYRVATNEFLAPAGQDGFVPFKYMTNITYWGDMLNQVNAYVAATYTLANPYRGPNGDGLLDGRIVRNGDGDNDYEAGEIVPLTVLHHNDSHGRLLPSGSYPGYTNLVTAINQERLHNPGRTLLLSAGDNIQGDSMMYFFKSAGLGYSADGTALAPELQINPLIKAFNAVGYDAWTLGNHEFNFGPEIFSTLAQVTYPTLQANITDTGAYGIAAIPVLPSVELTVGPENIDVAILGIGNHRIPSYELPSNIPGLGFPNPITTAQALAPGLKAANDVVIALTHLGFTENPASVEVDENVDTYLAEVTPGVDAVIGGHSHTSPKYGFGDYKYLPAILAGPANTAVLVTQMARYNSFLGEVVFGLMPDGLGGYDLVSKAGRYIEITTAAFPEDPTIKALIDPYKALIDAYNNTVLGDTLTPLDALQAYTQETNAANLQADASVAELASHGIPVDFHLSGAMTNSKVAATATAATPVTLKVSDMFSLMPYENSLVVMEMNGPQIKAVLERSYRNYYYYKYVAGYGGYSHYTTCFLDTNAGNQIVYNDTSPALPDGNNVLAFYMGGVPIDFTDASTYYRVSSVNYLAAGACNFSDGGVTLWPLGQIVNDTQYYVRDAVINYIPGASPINPQIEGRIAFPTAPVVDTPMVDYMPGNAVQAMATFTDTGDWSPYTCEIDYGDGSVLQPGVVTDHTCTGPVHSYPTAGLHTITVYVTDKAGLTGEASYTQEAFDFDGFYLPIKNMPPWYKAPAGSTIPVPFSLGGDFGMNVLMPGYPQFGGCGGVNSKPASGELKFSVWNGEYSFLWTTRTAWAKSCRRLVFEFVDGTSATAYVRFHK